MITAIKKEIVRLLCSDKNNISITFVGSSKNKKIDEISDIDVVVVCKTLTKKYYEEQIKILRSINKNLYSSKFENIYINNTFGPMKFNKNGNLVIHLMIYDLKTHKKHVIESPFTCLDWSLNKASYGLDLKSIYPIVNIQINDFRNSRRSFSDYDFEFKEKKLSFREYKFRSNSSYSQVKKYKSIEKIDLIEFMSHVVKFSIFNLCKFISNENKLFTNEEVYKILPEFKKFESLKNKLDRTKSDISLLNENEIKKEFKDFLVFFNNYLTKMEKEHEPNVFYFIRHSKTLLNDGSFLGIGRNPDIKRKINKYRKEEILNLNISRYFSSPLKRSENTIKQITNRYTLSKNLLEINYGKVEGMKLNEVNKKFPHIVKSWAKEKDVKFPNGENLNDVKNRLMIFIKKNMKNIPFIAFTHQVLIRVALCEAIGLPLNKSFKINIEHEKPYGFFILNKNIKTTLSRKEIYKIYKHD
tara:strand:+ start:461 stop:1870 length:1410 start_codon:yes stop_codon:yes gene_type:complete